MNNTGLKIVSSAAGSSVGVLGSNRTREQRSVQCGNASWKHGTAG